MVVNWWGPVAVGTSVTIGRSTSVPPTPAPGIPVPGRSRVARMNFFLALLSWNFFSCGISLLLFD
jgi:hypothetical protein